jgi:ribonuclease HI
MTDDAKPPTPPQESFEVEGQTYLPLLELPDGSVLVVKAEAQGPAQAYVVRRPSRAVKTTKVKPEVDRDPMNRITFYTDGSCLGNPGPGGWAYLKQDRHGVSEDSGGEPETTNNRMELTAAIEALKSLSSPKQVVIYSDSQLLIKTMTDGWKRKANLDLWEQLDKLAAQHQVSWRWVRGHDGHPENERADQLAQAAAGSQMAKGSRHRTR